MHRLPRWPVVLFALLGVAAPAGAQSPGSPQRMPVGPAELGTPSPVAAPLPAAPPAASAVPGRLAPVPSGPALAPPAYSVPAATYAPSAPAPAAVGKADPRGGQAAPKAHRWRLFRRRSADAGRPTPARRQ
ncbi:MAG TPA: hypothetical protein VFE78_38480 [Gemmataceae bacterium]|jgi:hypothetical protein|nr:hypothetical protein [Gemmataceae bacterium]